jgi:CheY-like chemotaxis protein
MTEPKTILVVDDHDAHLRMLELVLHAHRYEVAIASDGFEALAYLQAQTPAAMILDVHMPRMSGYEIGRRARRLRRLRDVPILMMTAEPDDATAASAAAIGAFGVLHKPIAGTDLRSTLAMLLS